MISHAFAIFSYSEIHQRSIRNFQISHALRDFCQKKSHKVLHFNQSNQTANIRPSWSRHQCCVLEHGLLVPFPLDASTPYVVFCCVVFDRQRRQSKEHVRLVSSFMR